MLANRLPLPLHTQEVSTMWCSTGCEQRCWLVYSCRSTTAASTVNWVEAPAWLVFLGAPPWCSITAVGPRWCSYISLKKTYLTVHTVDGNCLEVGRQMDRRTSLKILSSSLMLFPLFVVFYLLEKSLPSMFCFFFALSKICHVFQQYAFKAHLFDVIYSTNKFIIISVFL